MRLPRFRFTIRQYLVAVAAATILVTLSVEGFRLSELRELYLFFAEDHADHESEQRQTLAELASLRSRGLATDPLFPIIEDLARTRLAFHSGMRRKWQRLADHPWEPRVPNPEWPTDDRIVKKLDHATYLRMTRVRPGDDQVPPAVSIPVEDDSALPRPVATVPLHR